MEIHENYLNCKILLLLLLASIQYLFINIDSIRNYNFPLTHLFHQAPSDLGQIGGHIDPLSGILQQVEELYSGRITASQR